MVNYVGGDFFSVYSYLCKIKSMQADLCGGKTIGSDVVTPMRSRHTPISSVSVQCPQQ